MKTRPGGTSLSARALSSIAPRRVVTRTRSPAAMPSRRRSAGREAGDRLGLELVEHARAPGHRAGVPVLELPAGGQDHRVFVVGHLGRRHDRRRDQLAAAGGGREAVAEDDLVAGLVLGVAGIGHRALALEPLPGDAVRATASPASSRRRHRAGGCSSSRARCGARSPG